MVGKQKELKQTKILETSGKNKLDLCFNMQSEISEKETFYGEDCQHILCQNVDLNTADSREYSTSLNHRLNELKRQDARKSMLVLSILKVCITSLIAWLNQLHSKYTKTLDKSYDMRRHQQMKHKRDPRYSDKERFAYFSKYDGFPLKHDSQTQKWLQCY